jgi:hypothetical protein
MDTQTTQGIDWGSWFDRINTSAMTWYGIYQQNQPVNTIGQPGASVTTNRNGISASASLPILILGAVVILGAVYVYKKA